MRCAAVRPCVWVVVRAAIFAVVRSLSEVTVDRADVRVEVSAQSSLVKKSRSISVWTNALTSALAARRLCDVTEHGSICWADEFQRTVVLD